MTLHRGERRRRRRRGGELKVEVEEGHLLGCAEKPHGQLPAQKSSQTIETGLVESMKPLELRYRAHRKGRELTRRTRSSRDFDWRDVDRRTHQQSALGRSDDEQLEIGGRDVGPRDEHVCSVQGVMCGP